MNRNRRVERDSRVSGVAWVFSVFLLLGVSGLGYVWQKSQINQLGFQKRTLEKELRDLLAANNRNQLDIVELQTVARIEEKVKEMNIGLGYPQPEQVIRLVDSPWSVGGRTGTASNGFAPPGEAERR
jgi:hypothetical protein